MTKAEAIRAALKPGPLTLRDLLPRVERRLKRVVGRKDLYIHLRMMKTEGKIATAGRGDECTYALADRP